MKKIFPISCDIYCILSDVQRQEKNPEAFVQKSCVASSTKECIMLIFETKLEIGGYYVEKHKGPSTLSTVKNYDFHKAFIERIFICEG